MQRDLTRLANETYDVLVIGGGIYGACVAWDAALRGLSVALVEKGDFGGATSANSLKIIHGGLRYLQDGNLRLVRAMARERRAWLRIAPHLVHPLPCILPTYRQLTKSRPVLGSALALSDWLSFTPERRPDAPGRLPRSRMISRQECSQRLSGLAGEEITGGALWYDGQIYHPERLTLAVVLSAADAGANVANYVEAAGFLRQGTRITGIHACDKLSGAAFSIYAREVVNAAGPWVDRVTDLVKRDGLHAPKRPPRFRPSIAINLVTRQVLPTYAFGLLSRPASKNGKPRVLFVAPWREYSLIGTLHAPYAGQMDWPEMAGGVGVEETAADFLAEVRAAMPEAELQHDDVYRIHAGFLPAEAGESGVRLVRQSQVYDHDHDRDHDHRRIDHLDGLITVVGVKYTTARQTAEKVVDLLLQKLGRAQRPCRTATTPLYGGSMESLTGFLETAMTKRPAVEETTLRNLVYNYGSEYHHVLDYALPEVGNLRENWVLQAQVRYAIRVEMAQTLSDMVFRRTELGSAGLQDEAGVRLCLQTMAAELGWDERRSEREWREVYDQPYRAIEISH